MKKNNINRVVRITRSHKKAARAKLFALIMMASPSVVANTTLASLSANSAPAPIIAQRVIPGGQGSGIVGNDYAPSSLPILAVRNTYNIPFYLPYFLFCVDAIPTNYASITNDVGTLPAGVTMTVIPNYLNKFVRFVFTMGVATDTIDLSTMFPVPLPVIYSMMQNGDWFQGEGFQQTVGNNFNSWFIGVSLSYGQLVFSGAKVANAIPLTNAKSPFQYQNNIIIVNRRISINARRYIAMAVPSSAPTPGDDRVVNDFDINLYHSVVDFMGETVSHARTAYNPLGLVS